MGWAVSVLVWVCWDCFKAQCWMTAAAVVLAHANRAVELTVRLEVRGYRGGQQQLQCRSGWDQTPGWKSIKCRYLFPFDVLILLDTELFWSIPQRYWVLIPSPSFIRGPKRSNSLIKYLRKEKAKIRDTNLCSRPLLLFPTLLTVLPHLRFIMWLFENAQPLGEEPMD